MTDAFSPTRNQMERYVQGRLTGEEEAQVEIWLLENPDAVDDLQYDQALRLGIKEIGPEVAESQRSRRTALPSWLGWMARPGLAAAAATIMLAAILAPTIVAIRLADENQQLSEDVALLSQPTDTVYTLPLELTRSAEDRPDARILLEQTPYTVVLNIPVGPWRQDYDNFSIVLETGDTELVLTSPNVDDADRIQLALNSAVLRPGSLHITVQGDGEQIVRFVVAIEKNER